MRAWLWMVLGLSSWQTNACEFHFAFNDEPSLPYMLGGGAKPQAEMPGIAVELVDAAAKATGCQVRFSRLPTKRVLLETVSGRVDGSFMYSWNAERDKQLVYPKAGKHPDPARRIASFTYVAYRKKGSQANWDGQRFTGLNQAAIGINLGWSIAKDLAAQHLPIEEAPTVQINLNKLLKGRIALYITQREPGDEAIHHLGITGIECLPIPVAEKYYYVVFNRQFYAQHRDWVEQFWAALADRRDALTELLRRKYQD